MRTGFARRVSTVFLWVVGCQLIAAPAACFGQNYALQFKGGDCTTFDEHGDFVDLGYTLDVFPHGAKTIEFWCKPVKNAWSNIVLGIFDPAVLASRSYLDDNNCSGGLRLAVNSVVVATINNAVVYDEVQHLAVVDTGTTLQVYRNGELVGSANATWDIQSVASAHPTTQIGRGIHGTGARYFQGWIDELHIWSVARTQADIRGAMKLELPGDEAGLVGCWHFNEGSGTTAYDSSPSKKHGKVVGATWITDAAPVAPLVAAWGPVPGNAGVDVRREVGLSWTPAPSAAAHDVYFGTSLADVTNAGRTSPLGVLVSQGQATATHQPAQALVYGQTYYWRVDEVSAPPSSAIVKGKIWSFTVEGVGVPLVAKSITAVASSSTSAAEGPDGTVDGSGLNAAGQHSVDLADMWLSSVVPAGESAWIRYEFDAVYSLYQMQVWNHNTVTEPLIGFGIKAATVEYSLDGSAWKSLGADQEFARAPGNANYAFNTTIDFGGVAAKYVRITARSNWGGLLRQYGLAEVRFLYVPVSAREPVPASGATGLEPQVTLSWRSGRQAVSHAVYRGTAAQTVIDATAPVATVSQPSYPLDALNLGTTYYWKVNEINEAVTPRLWAGPVWSFTTKEYFVVDDFESYDDDQSRIYDTWIDGMTDGKSGSVVGYLKAPFAERAIVHGGKQSMPMSYDNSKTPYYSEAVQEFAAVQDWTGNGATHLAVWFRGYPAATGVAVTETAGKMTLTGAGADIWNNSDDFVYAYRTLTGDGSIVARVVSIGPGTNTWAKGGVMIRDSLNGGSTFVDMVLTANTDGAAGNGASLQYRLIANGACGNADAAAVIKAPYWVKLERKGDGITGYLSADGKTWSMQGTSQTIAMTAPVYLGLCVTSHQAGEQRAVQFDNIATTGNVTGVWQGAQINKPQYNDAAGLYAIVTDSTGKSKVVVHPDPAAAATEAWTLWAIPLSDLASAGVKATQIRELTLGVGDRNSPQAGGAGMLYLDDIGYGHPLSAK